MRVLNFGSVNVDHVYTVDHFVRPGETLNSRQYRIFAGGKGFNQSIALARAGAMVSHAGKIGHDGTWLAGLLAKSGVDTRLLSVSNEPTGHAIIQVTPDGENAIVIYGGANRCLSSQDIADMIQTCVTDDYVLVQNEVNGVSEIIRSASERGLQVVFNPAPMTDDVSGYPLELVDLFVVNETEAEGLTNETEPAKIQSAMTRRFPRAATVMTMGSRGAVYFRGDQKFDEPAVPVQPVDTTAAGDTFVGYFLAEFLRSGDPRAALRTGCRAAAICVTRPGAAESIPTREELGGT